MWCTQNFAFVADDEVKDVVVCDNINTATQIAKNIYGPDTVVLDVTRYEVQLGDNFRNGKFYRGKKEILASPSVEDRLNGLTASSSDLEEVACELTERYEERISDLEEAFCELSSLLLGGE